MLCLQLMSLSFIGRSRTLLRAAMSTSDGRVLAVQSHVVSGYVGNKSATFPLQLLGLEVDAINSVQFSNHTGYAAGVRGQVLNDEQLWELVEGLKANDLLSGYSHVINGYIGSESFLRKLGEVVKTLKVANPGLIYVCDPVMGDYGPGMYVPKALLPVYREVIVPMADVCLPNQFEAELLTESKIGTEEDALAAMRKLHDSGVKVVVLSSAEFGVQKGDSPLMALASDGQRAFRISIPRFPAAFVGTGDLFTALVTAWLRKLDNSLPEALERTIATMQAVLARTMRAAEAEAAGSKPSPKQMELKLIQSKADIENPQVSIKAEEIIKPQRH